MGEVRDLRPSRAAILAELEKGFRTCGQIATAVGQSERNVYRHIRELKKAGVPIRSAAGAGYLLRKQIHG